jgi:poly(3-hydroxybutyrate) depolymerase
VSTHPLIYSLLAAAMAFAAFCPRLQAEEDRPSVEHVLDFLREKMPGSTELLERVRNEEGDEGYAEVLENAGDLLMEYLEIKHEGGEEEAEAFLEEERGRVRMEALVEAWHEADEEAAKKGIEKEIARIIGVQIDRELAHGRRELEVLEAEVEKFVEELAEIEENRETIIDEELAVILFGEDEAEKEDEEPEHEGGEDGEFSINQSWSQEKDFPRPYFVITPERAGGEPLPVLIFLHGNGGNAKGARNGFLRRYPTLAREFITVFPDGYRGSWNIVSERSKADDLKFIEAIVLELAKRDDVREEEFTIFGSSNGAALANQIALESRLPHIKNIITAVSPLNGYQHDGENFKARGDDNDYERVAKPRAGRRLMNISGVDDRLVPYGGGPSSAIPAKGGKLPFVHAEKSIFLWAKQMGYEGEQLAKPSEEKGNIEIFSYLDGDIVHFKVNGRGHDATRAIGEGLILDFLIGDDR